MIGCGQACGSCEYRETCREYKRKMSKYSKKTDRKPEIKLKMEE